MRKDECKSHTKQDILHFLQSRDLECGIRTLRDLPTPQNLNNTESGAKIITQAMERNNEILVVGDYDADGVCASAIISLFLRHWSISILGLLFHIALKMAMA